MATNVNSNAISNGHLHVIDGVECVRWGVDRLSHENLTAERFKELSGNDTSFFEEWAKNAYPLLCNGWMFHPTACHVEDEGRVFALTFMINNAVCPDLENTYGIMTLASQNGGVTCEITNIAI